MRRIERKTVTDQVIDALLDAIQRGDLRPGDRLSPETELADRLGVGRSSVREALKALQFVGLLERHQDGTVVGSAASTKVIERLFSSELLVDDVEVAHLFQARRILEGEIASLAALRSGDEDLDRLHDLCRRMEGVDESDFEAYFDMDMAFHRAIAEIAGNPVLGRMWTVIQDLLESARGEIRGMEDVRAQSDRNHRRLVRALAAKDPAAARTTVHASLQAIEGMFLNGAGAERDRGGASTGNRSPPTVGGTES